MKKINILIAALMATGAVLGQEFTAVSPSPFEDITRGSSAFVDVDGDGDLDVIIAGNMVFNSNQTDTVIVYENDGTGIYSALTGSTFLGVSEAAFDVGDVNGDGHVDILITGYHQATYDKTSTLYLNDGTGVFTQAPSSVFEPFRYGTVNFGDVDNDGDLDILLTGRKDLSPIDAAKLYLNDGNGNFTLDSGTPFAGVKNGVVDLADVTGNGSLDVFISGHLYINDGNGNFTLQSPSTMIQVTNGDIAFEDIDNDGDLDAIVTGSVSGNENTKLYINDGSGNFTLQAGTPFIDMRYSSVAFSDINGDSYPDLLISGLDVNGDKNATFYINDGNGNYSIAPLQPTEQFSYGNIIFGDIDGDMDKDLLINGLYDKQGTMGTFESRITRLYTLCNLALNQQTLNPISATCSLAEPQAPEATDNCSGGSTIVTATTNTVFPITDTSITEIVWMYDNGNGLMQSQTQAINWQAIDTSITVNSGIITANNTNSGVTYQWIDCSNNNNIIPGETNVSFTPSHGGSYALIVFQNGCQDTSSCVNIELVGLEEFTQEDVYIYPNPSKGNITIELGKLKGILKITIYSSIGKEVYSKTVHSSSNKVSLSCSDLEEGSYIINIASQNQQKKARLLIVK